MNSCCSAFGKGVESRVWRKKFSLHKSLKSRPGTALGENHREFCLRDELLDCRAHGGNGRSWDGVANWQGTLWHQRPLTLQPRFHLKTIGRQRGQTASILEGKEVSFPPLFPSLRCHSPDLLPLLGHYPHRELIVFSFGPCERKSAYLLIYNSALLPVQGEPI